MSNHDEFEIPADAKPDVTPLEDDDLDAVAGGITGEKAEAVENAARADGRNVMLPIGNFTKLCMHNHKYKWARRKGKSASMQYPGYYYYDIKCYKCGKIWDEWYDRKRKSHGFPKKS